MKLSVVACSGRGVFGSAWACVALLAGFAAAQGIEEPSTVPTTRPSTPPVMQPVGPIDPQSVNDVDIGRHLNAEARKLVAQNALTPPAALGIDAAKEPGARAKVRLLPATAPSLTPEAIYRDRSASIVLVGTVQQKPDVRVNAASGFIISADGVIVTNYHVIAGSEKGGKDSVSGFVAMTRDGQALPVKKVLALSEKYDVAVVQVEGGSNLRPISIADRADVGSDVFVISHPSRKFWYFSRGMVARYSVLLRKTDPVDTLQITADYARGSSGAPILNASGEVIGMVCSTNSIYYSTEEDGDQKNLQMVMKQCVTSQQILELIERESR